ncbi:hypothetical protein ACQE98_15635 [Ornithinimicrobium sp. W1679]
MDDIWRIVLIVAVAAGVFLLVRWLATRQAAAAVRRRRAGRDRPRS